MEHVVFFPAPDGTPAFRRVGTLEEAVALVEHLRNVEGVAEVSVHELSEVALQFRPWYRVELPPSAGAHHAAPDATPVLDVPSVAVPPVAEAAPVPSLEGQAPPVVEVPSVEPPAAQSAPVGDAPQAEQPVAEAPPAEAVEGDQQAGEPDGRTPESAKSLGFFA